MEKAFVSRGTDDGINGGAGGGESARRRIGRGEMGGFGNYNKRLGH